MYKPNHEEPVSVTVTGDYDADNSTPFWFRMNCQDHLITVETPFSIPRHRITKVAKFYEQIPTEPGTLIRHKYNKGLYFLTEHDGWVHSSGVKNCKIIDIRLMDIIIRGE